MMNMQSMMKQAQKLQKQMQVSQEEIANTTFVGKSAQDLVTVEFSGDRTLKSLDIKPDVIDPEDPETLQDMVTDAVNDALSQIEKVTEQKLGKFTKGLPFYPFYKLLTELSESLYKLSEYKETRLFISNFFTDQKAMLATKKLSLKEG
ncbi:Nucleoid-associated protein [Lactococcus lactis]|nr:Nucleoid-associated protein [Lactococcus lactis]